MPPKNNNTPVDNAAARQQAIEKFLLDPDKAIFETLEQFAPAVMRLVDLLSAVNLDEMEQLVGKDGVTPVRGKDYMTEADLQALENFIISKIPKVGVELASRAQVEAFIRAEVAKIPRVKGDPGKQGDPGRPGNDGSPDTGADIVKKLRALGKNQMLKIDDIRGLENVLKRLVTDEQFEELKKRVDEFKIVIPANPGGGSSGADATAIHTDGENEFDGLTEDTTPAAGDYFIAERASDGVKIKVPFSAFAGSGDMAAAVYDPTNVAGDAFDMDNMAEGADTKIMTAAERAKLGHVTVSQAVNLDTMESDIAAAKAKTDNITVTQAVDLDAIEARVNDLDAAVVLRGSWDASAGTFPGGGTAQAGSSYIVSVAGTVNGVDFALNDRIVAITDNASTGTYANNWLKLDYTDQVLSVVGLTGAISKANLQSALDISGVNSGNETTTTIGALINGATSKTTPVDADQVGLMDSAASNVLKKLSWANIKATLKTYFDTLYQPVDSDLTTIAGLTATTNNFIVSVASAWASRTPAQVKATLSLSNVDDTSDATKNAATATLTNKRITKRVGTTASSSTPTPNADTDDLYTVTALAAGATFGAPTGTPTNGQHLIIRIKDDGTARTLAFNAIYRAIGITLPTTTVISKTIYLGMIYNSADTKWDVIAYALEA